MGLGLNFGCIILYSSSRPRLQLPDLRLCALPYSSVKYNASTAPKGCCRMERVYLHIKHFSYTLYYKHFICKALYLLAGVA